MGLIRTLVVHLPAFRLERCGFDADEIVGSLALSKQAMRLVAVTPGGSRVGLRIGMTASEARALVPGVTLIEHDPAGEHDDRIALMASFGTLSDRVTFPWDDALVLRIEGVAHLFDGEAGMAARALALATDLGHRVRVAIADDPLAALAIAVWTTADGGATIVPPGDGGEGLSALPIVALRPAPDLVIALRAVGVETVGQWAALDRAAVVGRYAAAAGGGSVALALHRIARGEAGGDAHLSGLPPEDPLRVQCVLSGATTTAELGFVLPGTISDLVTILASRDLAAVRLRIQLSLEDGDRHAISVRVGRPTRSAQTLEGLIRIHLDTLRLEAPAEALSIDVIEAVVHHGWQPGLADRSEATEPLPDLLTRLTDQLGQEAIFAACPADAWAPEHAWRPAPFPRPPHLGDLDPDPLDDPVAIQHAFDEPHPLPRPTLLLRRPEPIEVVQRADGSPTRVRIGGQGGAITWLKGPERLCGAWWDDASAYDRTYWAVGFESRRAWIFEATRCWFLHGWFD